MAERTSILIDSSGDPVGTLDNPLVIVASGASTVASLVDLTDVHVVSPASGDYIGYDPVTGKYVNKPVIGSGMGDVTGPNSCEDRSVAIFDDTSGKWITGTPITIDEDDQLNVAGSKIVGVGVPTESTDAANKYYVDQYLEGLTWKQPVESIEVASPPNPGDRYRYIVDESPVGDFIGHADEIAVWYADEGTWHFLTPGDGWACYNKEIDEVMVYSLADSSWVPIGTSGVPEAPVDGKAYCRMDAGWVKTSSDGSGILALTPVNPNCLPAFNDTDGVYLKEAGRGAYVNDGFFIRTPYGTGIGEYLLKLYASRDTETYGGILDLRTYYGCNDNAHPLIGFVSNMIKNAVASPFGGGLLINAHGPYGTHYPAQHNPNVALAVKPEGGTAIVEGLRVYQTGIVECLFGVNVPTGKTYNINGVPHEHSQYFESVGGAIAGVVDMSNNRITGVASPIVGSDAVNLDYISGFISGIIWKDPVLSQVASPITVNGRYLVAHSGTTGAFVGHEDEIATYDGIWSFEEPSLGWAVSNESDNFGYCYNGVTWAKMPGAVSHSSLQNLASDDHAQYTHISIPRTISAVHTFSNGFLISDSTQIVNLNASYIEGASKADLALAGHSHDFGTLLDFQVVDPASGEGLIYDVDLGKFVNGDIGSGGFVIDPNHQFADDTERDVYFATNPSELVNGVLIAVGTGFEQYDVDIWVDRTAVLRGPAGLDGRDGIDGVDGDTGPQGPQGEQGVQGIQGIQGPAGASGTNINLLGSVASPSNLPETATLHDAYIVNSDGYLYIWGDDDAWHNIGMVAGPQGPQGIQGPQGPTGTTGATGAKGDKGDIGLTGPPGAAGPRGPSGISIGWESPVESIVASPPENYDYNDRFLVSASPTGDFADHGGDIATWLSTDQWYFDTPVIGSMVNVLEVASYYSRGEYEWAVFSGSGGSAPQVNADWSATVGVASILNKPAIPAAQVNSDWDSTEGVTQILNKPTIPAEYVLPVATSLVLGGVKQGANVTIGVDGTISVASPGAPQAHATSHVTGGDDVIAVASPGGNSGLMSGSDKTKLDGIADGAEVNVNADWNSNSGDTQILNKPTIPSEYTLPVATASVLGGVKIGANVVASADGTISVATPDFVIEVNTAYVLPSVPIVGMLRDFIGSGNIWTVTASGDAVIQMGADASVANGVLTASGGYDCATLICVSSTKWVVKSAFGSFTLV